MSVISVELPITREISETVHLKSVPLVENEAYEPIQHVLIPVPCIRGRSGEVIMYFRLTSSI